MSWRCPCPAASACPFLIVAIIYRFASSSCICKRDQLYQWNKEATLFFVFVQPRRGLHGIVGKRISNRHPIQAGHHYLLVLAKEAKYISQTKRPPCSPSSSNLVGYSMVLSASKYPTDIPFRLDTIICRVKMKLYCVLYSQVRGNIMFKQLQVCSTQIHRKINLLRNSTNC